MLLTGSQRVWPIHLHIYSRSVKQFVLALSFPPEFWSKRSELLQLPILGSELTNINNDTSQLISTYDFHCMTHIKNTTNSGIQYISQKTGSWTYINIQVKILVEYILDVLNACFVSSCVVICLGLNGDNTNIMILAHSIILYITISIRINKKV